MNNVPSDAINDNTIQLNMRRLKINAQISATTSILEFAFNLLFIIIVGYYKGTNHIGLIAAITIYDIILPFALLANTSHNKNRVIESGWKNAVKNVIGFSNIASEENSRSSNETEGTSTSTVQKIKLNNHGDSKILPTTIYRSSSRRSRNLERDSTLNVPTDENDLTNKEHQRKKPDFVNLDANSLVKQRQNGNVMMN